MFPTLKEEFDAWQWTPFLLVSSPKKFYEEGILIVTRMQAAGWGSVRKGQTLSEFLQELKDELAKLNQ